MLYTGDFLTTISGRRVTVEIVTGGTPAPVREIGAGGLLFAPSPVSLTDNGNDTFDALICRSAVIRLLTTGWHDDMFARDITDSRVTVRAGDRVLFVGYIEPQTYSQPYSDTYNLVEINCVDLLTAMSHTRYRDAGSPWGSWSAISSAAEVISLREILGYIMPEGVTVLWDRSRLMADGRDPWLWAGVSESAFLGANEDSVWTDAEVLAAILKYLDLHAVQEGDTVYLYNWETIRQGAAAWYVPGESEPAMLTQPRLIGLSAHTVAGDDAQLSVGEVYSQLALTAELQVVDEVVDSPLDSSDITSPFVVRQLYLRDLQYSPKDEVEYGSESHARAETAFRGILTGTQEDIESGTYTLPDITRTDWYIQVMTHPQWTFNASGVSDIVGYARQTANTRGQQATGNLLRSGIGAALIQWTADEYHYSTDGLGSSSRQTETSLVVSVYGNGKTGDMALPTETQLLAAIPVAEYNGAEAVTLSPADEATTNYIVVSGRITMVPVMEARVSALRFLAGFDTDPAANVYLNKFDDAQGFYLRQWWMSEAANIQTAYPETDSFEGLLPVLPYMPKKYEYNYSAVGSSDDKISNFAVLACMLIVGDRCVVGTQHGDGSVSYEWRQYKSREACANDDEYYAQSFTLDINPGTGDYILGQEYELTDNVRYSMGIDAKGIAVKIAKSDGVSGKVCFKVLGPVNQTWDVITRRHRTWFRREKWSADTIELLPQISSIYVTDFAVRLYSNNGGTSTLEGKDLVYVSEVQGDFVNRKDDISFGLTSGLTAAERNALGVTERTSLSTVTDLADNTPVTAMTDGRRTAKPEALYLDAYYNDVSAPRKELSITVAPAYASRFARYTHPALPGVEFYTRSLSQEVREEECPMILRQRGGEA